MSRAEAEAESVVAAESVAVAVAERAEVVPEVVPVVVAGRHPLGLFRSELGLTFRRMRTLVLLGILAALPVLVGVVVKLQGGPGGGEAGGPFVAQIAENGTFLCLTSLALTLPVFLPMAVGVVAGDAIAGEASGGTLRYLLVAPAGRTRLLAAKLVAGLAFCAVATGVVAASALATGAALFPVGDVTLLSGDVIGPGAALLRVLLVAVVVAASLAGLVAIGLFVSTLTGSGIAAMATTVVLVITVQILDSFPQLHAIQPYLFTHEWLSFSDLLRAPMHWDNVLHNLGLQAVYLAVFGSAAWSRFTGKDITA